MIDIKNIYVKVFQAIKSDTEILDLLEIDYKTGDKNDIIKRIREQILDTPSPDDLLTNYQTRVCIYESTGSRASFSEKGYIRIDIHMTQDKNSIDRRLFQVAKKIIELLDTRERGIRGLKPISVGLDGLHYKNRSTSTSYGTTG